MAGSVAQWLQKGMALQVIQMGEKVVVKVEDITPDGWVRGKRAMYDSSNLWRVGREEVFVNLNHVGVVTIPAIKLGD